MEYIYTIREDGELILLTVTSKPTGDPMKTEKLFNEWASKIIKKEGHEAKMLKPNTHVAKHDKVSSTTWKFIKIKKEEPRPIRKSSRKTRSKRNITNTTNNLEE